LTIFKLTYPGFPEKVVTLNHSSNSWLASWLLLRCQKLHHLFLW